MTKTTRREGGGEGLQEYPSKAVACPAYSLWTRKRLGSHSPFWEYQTNVRMRTSCHKNAGFLPDGYGLSSAEMRSYFPHEGGRSFLRGQILHQICGVPAAFLSRKRDKPGRNYLGDTDVRMVTDDCCWSYPPPRSTRLLSKHCILLVHSNHQRSPLAVCCRR